MARREEVDPRGTVYQYSGGVLHSVDDQPAIAYANGDKEWYHFGKRHRGGDQPAVTCENGSKWWYSFGVLHRDGGRPALVDEQIGISGWVRNDVPDRDGDLPTVEFAGGTKWWQNKNREFHRDAGPAVINGIGIPMWFLNGIEVTKEGHRIWALLPKVLLPRILVAVCAARRQRRCRLPPELWELIANEFL